jgi:hypothetical protein
MKGRVKGTTYKKVSAYNINNIKKRFLSKIIKSDETECWIWIGSTSKGYGGFYCHFNEKGKIYPAHRISYMLFKEIVPDDKMVLHKNSCNNKLCVNPDHLYIGTHKDNMKDLHEMGTLAGKNNPNFGKHNVEKNKKISLSVSKTMNNLVLKEHLSKISKENWKNPIIRQNYLDGFKKRKRRKKTNE